MSAFTTRRAFAQQLGLGMLAAGGLAGDASAQQPQRKAHGHNDEPADGPKETWKPVSDRKIRVGIAGFGVCQFGAAFGYQDHPNVTVAAVSDLIPERCQALAKACRCEKTYPSLEEMSKDDSLEAIYIATDAPSHAQHSIEALKRGKHVVCAVPAVFGSLEDADKLLEAVKASGKKYMMNETSAFHADLHAMRQVYRMGGFGKLIYTEGEYFHYCPEPIASYRDWRVGLPPQWYPTHSNAYYVCVTGGSFTEVSCEAMPSLVKHLQPENNRYKNPFGTEVALLRTHEGGMARMVVSWDSHEPIAEAGRVRGQRGSMWKSETQGEGAPPPYRGEEKKLPNLNRPPLPPGLGPGGHGGSHGHLTEEFVRSILEDRRPLVDIVLALNMTVAGIVAHQSALKGGETLKIPQYQM